MNPPTLDPIDRTPDAGHTVREYVAAVWRRKGLVLLLFALGAAGGWWQGLRSPDVYAVATLIDIQKPKPFAGAAPAQAFGESYHESQLYYPTKWSLLSSRTYVDRLFAAEGGPTGRRFPVWDWLTWPVYLAERPVASRKDSLGPPIGDVVEFEALAGIPAAEFARRFSFRRYGLHPKPDARYDDPSDLAGYLANKVVVKPEKGTFLVAIELEGEERLALAPLLNLLMDVFWREQRSETQRRLDRERVFWGDRRIDLVGEVPEEDREAIAADVKRPPASLALRDAAERLERWKRDHASDARRLEQRTSSGAEQRRRGETQLRELDDQLFAAEPDLVAFAPAAAAAAEAARAARLAPHLALLADLDARRAAVLADAVARGAPAAEREALAASLDRERAELERRRPTDAELDSVADRVVKDALLGVEAEVAGVAQSAQRSRFHDLALVSSNVEVLALRKAERSQEGSPKAQEATRRELSATVRDVVLQRTRELRGLLAQRIAVRDRIARDDADFQEQGRLSDELAGLQRTFDRVTTELGKVDAELDRIRGQIKVEDEARPLRVIEPATDPGRPAKPNRPLLVGLGAAVGLLLGLALALVGDWLDDTVSDPDDVARHVGVPVVGSILTLPSRTADRVASEQPRSPVAEAFRAVRTSLEFSVPADGRGGRVLLVSSCSPREGKTTVAANLALVLAQDGKRTLLVDADLRKPRVHEVMGVDASRGLSNVIVGRERYEDVVVPTAHENLWVLPSGTLPPNPAELLGRPAVKALFDALRTSYDRIVVDTAPVGIVTDAAVLARVADTVLLVVAAGRTKKRSAEHGAALLATVGSPATGVIMNMVARGSRWAYGGYYERGARGYYGSAGERG